MFKFKNRNSKNWNLTIKVWEQRQENDGRFRTIITINHNYDNNLSYGAFGVFHSDNEELLKEMNSCINKDYLELAFK